MRRMIVLRITNRRRVGKMQTISCEVYLINILFLATSKDFEFIFAHCRGGVRSWCGDAANCDLFAIKLDGVEL